MRKALNVINIDGMDGVGKTSQIRVLFNYLNKLDIPVLINHLDDNIASAKECMVKTYEFLEKNPEGIVINDGSIARMIVIDLTNGLPRLDLQDKYKDIVHEYEALNHKYSIANLLLVIDDIAVCNDRILTRDKLFGRESKGLEDPDKELSLMQGMRMFDNTIFSKNLKFHVVETNIKDTILDVHGDILDIIKEDFYIKKPSCEG